jgi:DNA-binding XRE family transcriptional regulator
MAELSVHQKKEWAQMLYTSTDFTQKEIALKVGVSERSMSKWVNDGQWDKLRKSLLTTKAEQMRFLYDQLSELNKHIRDKEQKFANSKEADSILKITAAIKNLETETSVGQIIEVATQFIRFVQSDSIEKAQDVTGLFDLFIKERLKSF